MARFHFRHLSGIAYRATSYDTPLWISPNRRAGRWSRPTDEIIAQYCSMDPAAPLAEFLRGEDLRDSDLVEEVRMAVWALRIEEGAILDLSTPEKAAEAGVGWGDLVAEDLEPCQRLGLEIVQASGRGVMAPSAALPGSLSLTLFGARSELSWEMDSVLSVQIPARHLITGAPGPGVVSATRYRGLPYPEQVATNRASYRFLD